MAIILNSNDNRFRSKSILHTELVNNKHLVVMTGIAVIDFQGTSGSWAWDDLILHLNIPRNTWPNGKQLLVESAAPFVTINAIANQNHAVQSGYAVDEFEFQRSNVANRTASITSKIAIRDIDGILFRVGYSLTMVGTLTDVYVPQ